MQMSAGVCRNAVCGPRCAEMIVLAANGIGHPARADTGTARRSREILRQETPAKAASVIRQLIRCTRYPAPTHPRMVLAARWQDQVFASAACFNGLRLAGCPD